MKRSRWFLGLIALTAAFGLAGADLAAAQYYGGGRGQGGGRGVCLQQGQPQTAAPQYRQGQGQRQGQRQRLHRRDGSCLNPPASTAPTAPSVTTPGN